MEFHSVNSFNINTLANHKGLAKVHRVEHVVGNERLCKKTENWEQSRGNSEYEEAWERNQNVCGKERGTDVDVGEFFYDERDNIGSARGSPRVEEQGRADCGKKNRKYELEKGISRHWRFERNAPLK